MLKIQNNFQILNFLGRVKRLEDGNDKYIKILKSNFPKNFNLKGFKNSFRLCKWSML